MSYKEGGWKEKYRIQKYKGNEYPCHCGARGVADCNCFSLPKPIFEDVDPKGTYFVLRLDTDPHARKAALAYADSVEGDNPEFAQDIRKKVGGLS